MNKTCWVAKHYRNGWGLGFCIENKPTVWLSGIRFKSEKDVEKVLKNNIVFVYMAEDKPNA